MATIRTGQSSSHHAAETRTALLGAAESLFAARGYNGVGIREIVDRAGVNISAIKYHFGSKHELYLATVRHTMKRGRSGEAWERLHQSFASDFDAACALAAFVRGFLDSLLIRQEGENANCLICNEVAQPSAAIGDIVEHFIRPKQQALIEVIRVIVPRSDDATLRLVSRSILGQVLHYQMSRPFLDLMSPGETDDPSRVRACADHIVAFSLRALRLDDAVIERVLSSPNSIPTESSDSTSVSETLS